MCGITGVLSTNPAHRNPSIVNTMMEQIAHRGPDDNGMYTHPPVTIGFQRLAIVDLMGGHQPMHSRDGRYVLVFNGEIYNFRELRQILSSEQNCVFSTDCDTEVVMKAYIKWGADCFKRFNGMFALAIWDTVEQVLILARDRSGKKPLYIYKASETILFGSEVKSFYKHPAFSTEVDSNRLATSLAYRFVPHHETFFNNVHALQAGHLQVINGRTLSLGAPEPFWSYPPQSTHVPSLSADATADYIYELLEESVRLRMVADVPVGAFLSGGIDSSLIVALMAKNAEREIRTFSIGFDTGFSEHEYAKTVATNFKTKHQQVLVSAEDLLKEITQVLWYRETPISEPSDIPLFMLAREARRHVTVVLSGEGSDELFGGYPKYVAEYYASRHPQLTKAATGILKLKGTGAPAAVALASMSETDKYDRMSRWFGAFGSQERHQLLTAEFANHLKGTHCFAQNIDSVARGHSYVTQMQIHDHAQWLPANLLLRGDRVTMANSLEMRCPFLDPALVNFALGNLPDYYKVRRGQSKWIIRQMAKRLLPTQITKRPKWGFKVPVGEWFHGPLRQTLTDVVLSPIALQRGYFQPHILRTLIDDHLVNGVDHRKQLWYLFQLELWHLMFIDKTLIPGSDLREIKSTVI